MSEMIFSFAAFFLMTYIIIQLHRENKRLGGEGAPLVGQMIDTVVSTPIVRPAMSQRPPTTAMTQIHTRPSTSDEPIVRSRQPSRAPEPGAREAPTEKKVTAERTSLMATAEEEPSKACAEQTATTQPHSHSVNPRVRSRAPARRHHSQHRGSEVLVSE